MLMNFQAESMPSTVEKSDATPVAHFGWETATGEKFLNGFVNRHAVNARLDSLQGEGLPCFYRFPNFSLRVARASPQHRAGHIAEISGLRIAREHIENNQ